MDPRVRATLLGEARRWASLGLVDAKKLPEIEALYPESVGDVGTAQLILFGLGGAVVAAAVIAFGSAVLHLTSEAFAMVMLLLGITGVLVGAALRFGAQRPDWADASFVAGAVGLIVAGFQVDAWRGGLSFVQLAGGLLLPVLAHRRGAGPGLGALLYFSGLLLLVWAYFSSPGFFFPDFNDAGSWLVFALASAYLGAGIFWAHVDPPARAAHLALSCVGVALATALFVATVIFGDGNDHHGLAQLLVAIPQLALVAVGYVLRIQQLLLGASLCSAVLLTMFAFAVGGPILGVAVLLGLAVAFIALALRLRKLGPASS